ncbi:MAG TPA: transcriptional repressor [Verrucomicrobiae bacterium]|nr:transcriptional repressor [Verrucomicrobiae bacterium]
MAKQPPKESPDDYFMKALRALGYRITMPRTMVARAFAANTGKLMSAYGLHEWIINTGGKIDVVSVYRIIVTLIEASLIRPVPCGKEVLYVFVPEGTDAEAPLFINEETRQAKPITGDEGVKDLFREMLRIRNISYPDHRLTLVLSKPDPTA